MLFPKEFLSSLLGLAQQAEPPKYPPEPQFDPNLHEDQRDNDWYYHWHEDPEDKHKKGGSHWDRGHLRDGKRQEWSPDGTNWYPKSPKRE
ncbi:MAG: hypothetical protein AB1422_10980 [bacterium]